MAPIGLENFVEKIQVRGIAVAIQGLQIVALQKALGDINLVLRHAQPGIGGKQRLLFSRSEVSEHHPAGLDARIRRMANFIF
jgi:hypothetical protein